mgnify:CR=1 FL=1
MSDLAATNCGCDCGCVVIPDVAQDVDVTITVAVIMAAEIPCLETVETAAPVSFGSSV